MIFVKAIAQNEREYMIFSEDGRFIPVDLNIAIGSLNRGIDTANVANIMRTAKYLAGYENRNITEGQANAAMFNSVEILKSKPAAFELVSEVQLSKMTRQEIVALYAKVVDALNQ